MQVLIIFVLYWCTAFTNGANSYWRDYNGTVPSDAFSAEKGIYIAQVTAQFCNGVIPGTLYAKTKTALSECYGKGTTRNHFKVLCTPEPDRFYWKYVNVVDLQGEDPESFVKGGNEGNTIVYIGKIYHEGAWKVSKVFLHKGCIYWNALNLGPIAYEPAHCMILKYN